MTKAKPKIDLVVAATVGEARAACVEHGLEPATAMRAWNVRYRFTPARNKNVLVLEPADGDTVGATEVAGALDYLEQQGANLVDLATAKDATT